MDDDFMVTAFVVLDKTMAALGHRDDVRAKASDAEVLTVAVVSDAEVLTVAVVAARYFQNHPARALGVMQLGRYLSGPPSVSRFKRRLHALRDSLALAQETLGALFARGEIFRIDSMPVPVCRRARARRCRKASGKAFCGYCAARRERFFGWRLHLVCTTGGVPIAFALLSGWSHDLTLIHALTYGLPAGASVYGDKGDNAADDEASIAAETDVRLVPIHRTNMRPLSGPTSWRSAPGASASRRGTASWRRWACSASARAPTPAWNSSSTPPCSR